MEAIYKEAVEKLPKEPDFDCVMGNGTGEKDNMKKSVQILEILKQETWDSEHLGYLGDTYASRWKKSGRRDAESWEITRKTGPLLFLYLYILLLNTDHKDVDALLTPNQLFYREKCQRRRGNWF